jgi:tetratricopeptide (TPR) repeat protein
LTKAAELEPGSALAWHALAGSYESLGVMHQEAADLDRAESAYDRAIVQYRKAATFDPNSQTLKLQLIVLQRQRNGLRQVTPPFEQAVQQANSLLGQEAFEEAAATFAQAAELIDPGVYSPQEVAVLEAYCRDCDRGCRLARDAIRDPDLIAGEAHGMAEMLWMIAGRHAAMNHDFSLFAQALEQLAASPGQAQYYASAITGAMLVSLPEYRQQLRDNGIEFLRAAVEARVIHNPAEVRGDQDMAPYVTDSRFHELLLRLDAQSIQGGGN